MITAKEKAKELIKEYDFVYIQNYTSMFEVKQCAIIAVENIINFNKNYIKNCFNDEINDIVISINNINKFFEKVIIEIENYEC